MILSQLKLFIKDKQSLFWSFLFPLILAIFFQLALGNLTGGTPLETIPIAYLNSDTSENYELFDEVMREIETDEGYLYKVVSTDSNEQALSLLENDEVVALIDVSDDTYPMTIKDPSISQSVVKSTIEAFHQNTQIFSSILQMNPSIDIDELIATMNNDVEYFEENSSENTNFSTIYFYSLIGMQAMYGALWGLKVMNQNEANQSVKGMRVQVSPVSKSKLILSGLIASVILHFISMLILLAFLMFVLQVEFGDHIAYIILLCLLGSITGVSFGFIIGASSKGSFDAKIGISIGLSMAMSALAGMMYSGLDLLVRRHVPFLATINPIAQISQGLQSLYYYDDLNLYVQSLFNLGILTIVMISISIFLTRRKTYDSL